MKTADALKQIIDTTFEKVDQHLSDEREARKQADLDILNSIELITEEDIEELFSE